MSSARVVPVLLSALVGALLSLVVWGFRQARRHEMNLAPTEARHDLLLWLLVLTAFALGAFVTYALLHF